MLAATALALLGSLLPAAAPPSASATVQSPSPTAAVASTPPSEAPEVAPPPVAMPELGTIRYRDPTERRSLWLGADVSGVYVPRRLGLFDRDVWTVRPEAAWALALTSRIAVGGRHGVAWYDATNVRLRVRHHTLEVSGRPLGDRPGLQDRLSVGASYHDIASARAGGVEFKLGGLRDVILHAGYGIDHELGRRFRLGWQGQFRYAFVFENQQRQLRLSVRPGMFVRPRHFVGVELVGFYVHRDADQAGQPMPRHSVHGQAAADYTWMSRANVGLAARVRVLSSFMSGEAPIYELREESLDSAYGEATLGLRYVWK